MRVLSPWIVTLVISVFLAGCGEQETSVEETKEERATGETTAEKTNDRAEATVEEHRYSGGSLLRSRSRTRQGHDSASKRRAGKRLPRGGYGGAGSSAERRY